MNKVFLALLLFLIGWGVYFFFFQQNVSHYIAPVLETLEQKSALQNQASDTPTVETLSALTEQAIQKAKQTTTEFIDEGKAKVFDVFKGAIDTKVADLGNNFGISFGNSEDTKKPGMDSLLVTYTIKVGTPAYFTLENREQDAFKYTVDLADGAQDTGHLEKDKTIVLNHKWATAGNYEIQFKSTAPSGEKNYKISIAIF